MNWKQVFIDVKFNKKKKEKHMFFRNFLFTFLSTLLAICFGGAQSFHFDRAYNYSKNLAGHAMLVMLHGRIVYEKYASGWSSTNLHPLASGTKSFSGVLCMMAVQDGLLKLDEKLADTITEWKNDPRKSKITYRQLLTLTSGIKGGRIGVPVSYSQAIKAPTFADPGKAFSYGPVPFQIFGEALKRKLRPKNMSVADYIKKKILNPLGITRFYWRNFNTGEPYLNAGAYLTARDWAKYGELLRGKGSYGGKNLLSPNLLKECFKGTKVNPQYGLTFWLPQRDSIASPGSAFARGAGKQRLYFLPVQDMVVIRYGNTPQSSQYNDDTFLRLLFSFYSNKWAVSINPISTATFNMDAGNSFGGKPYIIFGSFSGTVPGFDYDNIHVALNIDPLFWITFTYPNTPPFQAFQGVLDSNGKAKAYFKNTFTLPSAVTSIKMFYTYVIMESNKLVFSSNPILLGFKL